MDKKSIVFWAALMILTIASIIFTFFRVFHTDNYEIINSESETPEEEMSNYEQ